MNKKYLNPKTGEKYSYYDRTGKGIEDTLLWAKKFDDFSDKIVQQERIGPFGLFWVSTVWLGLDHSFLPYENPLIFESMVFCRFPLPRFKKYLKAWGYRVSSKNDLYSKMMKKSNFFKPRLFEDCGDLDMLRYTTETQARAGHTVLVKIWSNPSHILSHLWDHLFGSY